MHKEMLNIGKIKEHNSREKQVVEILEKATRRRPPKTNVGRKRKVQQLARSTHARTHTDTDRQTIGNREAVENVAGTAGEKMQLGDSMANAEHAAR